jgi:signal transduction histidine kinase
MRGIIREHVEHYVKMRLTTKLYTSILAVTGLALLSSVLGLFATWQMAVYLREMTYDDLPSVREAEKLESTLLKQGDCDESYLLDSGNQRWLKVLAYRKRLFQQWLETAKSTPHDSTEKDILARLENSYRKFDTKRDEVFTIYDSGDAAKAKQVLLEELDPLSDHVNDVCEEFIEYIERYIDTATARAETRTRHLMWIVSGFVGLTAISGCGLLWLFIYGVHAPLRKMIADARTFANAGRSDTTNPPQDAFSAAGFYLRTLMSDVTNTRSALRRSRQQALNAEKLAAVGKLAATVAHEIRNPLVAVKLWLTTIQKKRHTDLELCRDLDMLLEEMTRLDGIVRDFLEFSRPRALNIEPLQLASLLDETLELAGRRLEESRIYLVRKYSPELPSIMGDGKQLKQVFINLLNNAAEVVPEGGEIRVITASASDHDARPMVVVRIQDTGSGMPEEVQKRLFEPFFTTKESGTGLGLCIAAGIMTRHNGRLVLESSTGQGTTFAVWIPAAEVKHDANLHSPQSKVKIHE